MSEPGHESRAADFIRARIAEDVRNGKHDGRVMTRFPPEPNGHLHIGHAKSISVNFGIAAEFGGVCNLRFDDTNPEKEEAEFVEAIQRDVAWLGYDWEDRLYFASDYFEQLYELAVGLIEDGKAFVCDLTGAQIREYRGTLTEPGRESPYRDRGIDENLDLFARMRAGEFPDGARTLRAKIDVTSGNINLRDPVIYRIQHATHHRTGDAWCIYPMYDFQHPLSDAIEGVTHSLCSIEFEDHRPLYDWVVRECRVDHVPTQIEFARMNVSYMVGTSKRLLRKMVEDGVVEGWDDPRMPTICGVRRRGYPPEAIVEFCESVGLAKRANLHQLARLEHEVREVLNAAAPRVMGVLDPIPVTIENYPEGQVESLEAINNPEDPSAGTRELPFSRVIYIERDDFLEDPPRKFFRLGPGREVRLRYGYFITCTGFEKDADGNVTSLRASYDPETRGGQAPDGRKVKGTIHWVSAGHALDAEVRLYKPLFDHEAPIALDENGEPPVPPDPESRIDRLGCKLEPSLAEARPGDTFQLERLGYFSVDPESRPDHLVLNRTVTLRDTWAKVQRQDSGGD